MPRTEATDAVIQVTGYDGELFRGPAQIRPATEGDWQWALEFRVPAERVAQFQARRGEEVELLVNAGRVQRAWVGGFRFESDASATGTGGHGRIQLVGRGEPPA